MNFLKVTLLFAFVQCRAYGFQSTFVGKGIANIARPSTLASSASSSALRMQMPVLDDWNILKNGSVRGIVRNHPVLAEGDTIQTSPLVAPDAATAKKVVMTKSGSKYRLGSPSSQQKKANGQAKAKPPPKAKPKAKPKPAPAAKTAAKKAAFPSNPFQAKARPEPAAKPKSKPAPAAKAKPKPAPKPKAKPKPAPKPQISAEAQAEKALQDALRQAKADYSLTGKAVGDGNYLLAGKPRRSTSGKSNIYMCYKNDGKGLPVGGPLCAKISTFKEAMQRETENYERVTKGLTRGQFVKFIEYYDCAAPDDRSFSQQCAIIIERGECDLRVYLGENGGLSGKPLRDAAVACIQCLQACHSANLVWTDMKAENFVVTEKSQLAIKGIDLESAMPARENPVDYSPEACPPEFAQAFLAGDGSYFVLEKSYDIWSLGMILYEISTGFPMFTAKSPSQITQILGSSSYTPDTSLVPDESLRELIDSCLDKDPTKRPALGQILVHPFFLKSGIGPFSW